MVADARHEGEVVVDHEHAGADPPRPSRARGRPSPGSPRCSSPTSVRRGGGTRGRAPPPGRARAVAGCRSRASTPVGRRRRSRPAARAARRHRPGASGRYRARASAATATFSRTDWVGNRRRFWNVRARPARAMRCGGSSLRSASPSVTVPGLLRRRAGDDVEQRGLARAVGADQPDDLARPDPQAGLRRGPGTRRTAR